MLAVKLENISKRFGRLRANDQVNLSVHKGSIHAIVGENGAGKSTLMNVLYGLYRADSGTISIHGNVEHIDSPAEAIRLGIGMVHQHFMLVSPLTVTENIILGEEPTRLWGFLDIPTAEKEIRRLSDLFHLKIDPNARISELSVGVQQRVEILKILYRKADILILDEPTAVLTPQEIDDLFKTLSDLKQQEKTVILITHKLNEVMTISDRVTVMRQGNVVGDLETSKTTQDELTRLLVGRSMESPAERQATISHTPMLIVENVSVLGNNRFPVLHEVSFTVDRGEILGIAGVEGNGQSELVEILAGLRIPSAGTVKTVEEAAAASGRGRRFAHVPEDRWKRGLVLEFPLVDNFILGRQREHEFSGVWFLRQGAINLHADRLIKEFDIRPPDKQQSARALSGGNQQKVVIARELSKNADVIIASQPTRGLDIGAIEYVHNAIMTERNRGKAVVLVSSELSELLRLSDRIAVMYKGQIVVMLETAKTNEREIGHYMTGGSGRVAV